MLTFRKRQDGKYRVIPPTAYAKITTINNTKHLEMDGCSITEGIKLPYGTVSDIQYSKGAILITVE